MEQPEVDELCVILVNARPQSASLCLHDYDYMLQLLRDCMRLNWQRRKRMSELADHAVFEKTVPEKRRRELRRHFFSKST